MVLCSREQLFSITKGSAKCTNVHLMPSWDYLANETLEAQKSSSAPFHSYWRRPSFSDGGTAAVRFLQWRYDHYSRLFQRLKDLQVDMIVRARSPSLPAEICRSLCEQFDMGLIEYASFDEVSHLGSQANILTWTGANSVFP